MRDNICIEIKRERKSLGTKVEKDEEKQSERWKKDGSIETDFKKERKGFRCFVSL